MILLESVVGEDSVSRAYFQNKPELISEPFERVMGAGSWQQLLEAFDDSLSNINDTAQEGRIRDDLINRFIKASSNNASDWRTFIMMNEVYESIIKIFLMNINEKDKEVVRDKYLEYLHNSYDSYFNKATNSDFNAMASFCVKKEKLTHLDISEEAKMAFLFPDKKYIELEQIAFEIAHLANKKKNGECIDERKTIDEYLSILDHLNADISERYRFSADRIYSDAIVDLKYIFEDESIESIRLQQLQQ